MSRNLPGLGLVAGYPEGFDGWGTDYTNNHVILSALVQAKVLDRVASVPGSPTDGDIYLIASGGDANKIAIRDNDTWVYVVPTEGFKLWVADEDQFYIFDGTNWAPFTAPASGNASDITNDSGVSGATVKDALDSLQSDLNAAVASIPATASDLVNDSAVSGATVKDALEALAAEIAGGGYTDEQAQDAVGATLADTPTIDLTYDDAANQIKADVKDNSIEVGKMHATGSGIVFGRKTAAAGAGEELSGADVLEMVGSTQGVILYRGPSAWGVLAPGNDGEALLTHSAGQNPTWGAVIRPGASSKFTKGYTAQEYDAGTKSSGNWKPDPENGNLQKVTANGGFELTAPDHADSYTMAIKWVNGASAATITFSGFTRIDGAFDATSGHKFMVFITKIDDVCHLNITALQ